MLLNPFWRGVLDPFKSIANLAIGAVIGFIAAMFVFDVAHMPAGLLPIVNTGGAPHRTLPQSPYRDEIKAAAFATGIDPNIYTQLLKLNREEIGSQRVKLGRKDSLNSCQLFKNHLEL